MNATKQLWVLAGGNGAGKSTFYRTQLAPKGVEFVNADIIEKQLDLSASENPSYQAATIARSKFATLIEQGRSFCFETVFSHESKLDMIKMAQDNGYVVTLVFIHLKNPQLNELRVKQRMSEGGHWVPPEKIATRIERTLKLMQIAVKMSDRSYLLDNSSRTNPFQQIAVIAGSQVNRLEDPLPAWAKEILQE